MTLLEIKMYFLWRKYKQLNNILKIIHWVLETREVYIFETVLVHCVAWRVAIKKFNVILFDLVCCYWKNGKWRENKLYKIFLFSPVRFLDGGCDVWLVTPGNLTKREKNSCRFITKANNSQNQETPSPYGICTNVLSAFRGLLSINTIIFG